MSELVPGLVREILEDPVSSVLIFVYQTAWAATLARALQTELGELCGSAGAACYHSRMSAASKARVRAGIHEGAIRCVVSTAALAMGVNLPATHVIVRDLNFGPGQPISVGGLQQMTGRAGRGERPGRALLVLKPGDSRSVEELRQTLEREEIPPLQSVFLVPARTNGTQTEPPLAKVVLSFLSRRPNDRFTTSQVEEFIRHTMNGSEVVHECLPALRWLGSPSNLLAFEEDGEWISTRVGQAAGRSSLPLRIAAGVAQLIRDLLSVDDSDRLLMSVGPLDLLLLVELTAARPYLRKPFSEKLAEQVDDWASRDEAKSIIFQEWIRGQKGFSQASELLGSLGVGSTYGADEPARKYGYQAMLRTIILWQLAHGALPADLERRWKVTELEGVQEGWRDDRLFLLGAMSSLWDVRCFYFHLREECGASDDRVHMVKRALQRMRGNSLRLLNLVSWCSPLGPTFLKLRSLGAGGKKPAPGKGTMRRLEEAGITSVQDLGNCSLDQLLQAGVRRDMAQQIMTHVRTRLPRSPSQA